MLEVVAHLANDLLSLLLGAEELNSVLIRNQLVKYGVVVGRLQIKFYFSVYRSPHLFLK